MDAQRLNLDLEALPIAVLSGHTFGVVVWKRPQEIAELKGMVRWPAIIKKRCGHPQRQPIQHLFSMISKSQQGFRPTDRFLDAILLPGSRRSDKYIGQSIDSFVTSRRSLPGKQFGCRIRKIFRGIAAGNPIEISEVGKKTRFIERRSESGEVRSASKKRNAVYFRFVAHSHACATARCTSNTFSAAKYAMKRSEARFTPPNFRNQQEAIYIRHAEDKILGSNPAPRKMLGYFSTEELLPSGVQDVFADE